MNAFQTKAAAAIRKATADKIEIMEKITLANSKAINDFYNEQIDAINAFIAIQEKAAGFDK